MGPEPSLLQCKTTSFVTGLAILEFIHHSLKGKRSRRGGKGYRIRLAKRCIPST